MIMVELERERKSLEGIFVRLAKAATSFFHVAVPRIFPWEWGSYTNWRAHAQTYTNVGVRACTASKGIDTAGWSDRKWKDISLDVTRGNRKRWATPPFPLFYTSRGCETPWNRKEVSPVTTAVPLLRFHRWIFQPISIPPFVLSLLRYPNFISFINATNSFIWILALAIHFGRGLTKNAAVWQAVVGG